LLKQDNISVLKAEIGKITKQDISQAKANAEIPGNSVILGFNVSVDEEAAEMKNDVKIIEGDVVYKLIEDLKKWQEEKRKEIEKEKLLSLASICKLEILPNFVFHNSNPAIFGVRVLGGKLKPDIYLIDENNEKISHVKNIQHEKTSLKEAVPEMEVAISLPGIAFDRQLKNSRFLYADLSEAQFRKLKENKDVLSSGELKILQEIASMKRKEKAVWGV